jgi:protein involved in polysaccharide export with SLBB domain
MNFFRILLTVVCCFSFYVVNAQVPSDLSRIKASQISDSQLQQLLNQANARGLTAEQVEEDLIRRGLPAAELSELKLRIQQLQPAAPEAGQEVKNTNTVRRTALQKQTVYDSLNLLPSRPKLFGLEMFSNSQLSFEPDLRMPTPKNYIIGPDDELILQVYGLNMSQQNLKVSPEGTVNLRYAGVVPVNDLTIEAAASLFKSRLAKYYPGLKSGQTKLQLSLGNIRSIRVTLIGAINRPGTYTLPSLATLFNALYVSGGPADNGSFRNIELVRNSKVIATADLYDFLVRGDQTGNLRLEDNDVIRVPFARLLVTLNGELNRPGIFELKKTESLGDAIEFAGGFKSKAFQGRITGNRFTNIGRSVIDVVGDSLHSFVPRNGDEYFIDSVINRYENRVVINGAVLKPGSYALDQGMTLKNLVDKAQGVKEDVYGGRAIVVRTRADLTKEYLSVKLEPILSGLEPGIALVKDDSVHVASIFDLKDTITVTINGAVRNPGIFRYEDSLSLKSLILKAGGYAENATAKGIEISRRKRDVDVTTAGSKIVELINIDENKDLANSSGDFQLRPFDIITIKEDPYYKKQISVKISGEVLMPAVYTLQSREERLSSLIQRSGGLLYTANVKGAKLIRQRKGVVDTTEVLRLLKSLEKDTTKRADSTIQRATRIVAIDLAYILSHPQSEDDITLEEGDELYIPRINNTVSIYGEVYKPVDIMYEKGKNMKDYLSDAGGATQMGKSSKAFVIYANGGAAKIKRTLGIFPSYPKIYPGSSIFVPQKPKRDGTFDAGKAGILVSAITALVTAVALLTN